MVQPSSLFGPWTWLTFAFEKLHGTFVLLRSRARIESAKVLSLARFRILLLRVEPVLA